MNTVEYSMFGCFVNETFELLWVVEIIASCMSVTSVDTNAYHHLLIDLAQHDAELLHAPTKTAPLAGRVL